MSSCDNLDLGWLAGVWQRLEDFRVHVLPTTDVILNLVDQTCYNLRGKVHNFKLLEWISSGVRFNIASLKDKEFAFFFGWLLVSRVSAHHLSKLSFFN